MTGWIVNREFIECKPYAHVSTIFNKPELRCLIPNIEELEKRIDDSFATCLELEELEGSNCAEWHTYERACDDAHGEAIRAFLRAGAVRVGSRDMTMYFEAMSFDKPLLKKFATSHGFTNVRYEEM